MRVGIWHNLPCGGAKRALHTHVTGLLRRGHHVEIWCPPTADRTFLPLDSLAREHIVPLGAGQPAWWSEGRRGLLRSSRGLINAVIAHSSACAEEMQSADFDVYLAASCQFFGAPPIARFLPGRTVLYLQEPQRWLYEASPTFPWLGVPLPTDFADRLLYPVRSVFEGIRTRRRRERANFEVVNAGAFQRILVNSLYSRESVLRAYGLDSTVCYLGVDSHRFRRTSSVRDHMVVGVGSLSTQKNALLLVESVGRLPTPRPRVEWVTPNGDARYAEELRRAALRASVELIIHRAIDDAAVVDVLSRARTLVYTPRLEPFGLVPLEAGACELAVIGVAEGGVRETVVDGVNGLLVASKPDDIAAAIGRLLHNDSFAEGLGIQGRRTVEERWTLDHAAIRLEAALAEVAQTA